jgi:hypothetical protein
MIIEHHRRRKKMKRSPFLGVALVLAVALIMANPVMAHTPADLTLEYDFGTQTLTVTVSHSVGDTSTHYIESITILKNDVEYTSRDYNTQDTTSGMSDTFSVDAVDGDVLQATAVCSIAGSVTRQITVTAPTTTSTDTTTTETTTTSTTSTTPTGDDNQFLLMGGIAAAIGIIGILLVAVVIVRRR